MITIPKTNYERQQQWRKNRKKEGWRYFSRLVSPELYEALQATLRRFTTEI